MPTPGIRKLYYSIREVAEATDLKPHVLRYWESEFDDLAPKKNRAGNRAYTERDIEVVERIRGLLRDEKYTIDGAKQVLAGDVPARPAPSVDLSRAELEDLRAFLADVLRRL